MRNGMTPTNPNQVVVAFFAGTPRFIPFLHQKDLLRPGLDGDCMGGGTTFKGIAEELSNCRPGVLHEHFHLLKNIFFILIIMLMSPWF